MPDANIQSQMTEHFLQDNQYPLSILSFDNIEILLAQKDIRFITPDYTFEKNTLPEKHLGYITDYSTNKGQHTGEAGKKLNAYAFCSELKLIKTFPEQKPQCVILKHSRGEIAVLCRKIRNITLNNIHIQTIPQCMNSTRMPLTHLCLYQEPENDPKLGMMSNADSLFNYILNYV
ncbi:hypothetical protein MNBD_GAMMA11-54 [hydrothermal vent metagenome]|uniref:Uncharacterized protein n=1 Tax=hydrothermal vent metagenome TaxID=652676 RepID=A0A3B0X7I0_9ZZZZ